jgi:hypothetical protein
MDDPPSAAPPTAVTQNGPTDDATVGSAEDCAPVAAPPDLQNAATEKRTAGLPEIPRGPALNEKARSAAAGSDNKAQKEEDQLGSKRTPEQLASDAAELEHGRTQRFRDAFEHMAIGALIVGTITILVLAVIWALHLVLSPRMRWLSPEDLTHIQTLLTAGVLVGVVSSHFKKRLGDIK